MNKWFGTGRLTKDPIFSKTSNDVSYARFTIACEGWQKDKNGKPKASFFNCVVWRERADFVEKYCKKGDKVGVFGAIDLGVYEKDGKEKASIEVTVEQMELLSSKLKEDEQENKRKQQPNLIEINEDYLPF